MEKAEEKMTTFQYMLDEIGRQLIEKVNEDPERAFILGGIDKDEDNNNYTIGLAGKEFLLEKVFLKMIETEPFKSKLEQYILFAIDKYIKKTKES